MLKTTQKPQVAKSSLFSSSLNEHESDLHAYNNLSNVLYDQLSQLYLYIYIIISLQPTDRQNKLFIHSVSTKIGKWLEYDSYHYHSYRK